MEVLGAAHGVGGNKETACGKSRIRETVGGEDVGNVFVSFGFGAARLGRREGAMKVWGSKMSVLVAY